MIFGLINSSKVIAKIQRSIKFTLYVDTEYHTLNTTQKDIFKQTFISLEE